MEEDTACQNYYLAWEIFKLNYPMPRVFKDCGNQVVVMFPISKLLTIPIIKCTCRHQMFHQKNKNHLLDDFCEYNNRREGEGGSWCNDQWLPRIVGFYG
jgi:hypothetical protein